MKIFTKRLSFGLGLVFSVVCLATQAEVIRETKTEVEEILIPLAPENIKSEKNTPVRGMSMSTVKQQYGTPKKVHPTTGKPPITRWDYPEFSVYFESSFVIHSVNRKN